MTRTGKIKELSEEVELLFVHTNFNRHLLMLRVGEFCPFAIIRRSDPVDACTLGIHLGEQVRIFSGCFEDLCPVVNNIGRRAFGGNDTAF